MLTSTHFILIQPQHLQFIKSRVGKGIDKLLHVACWGMDEHGQTSKNIINSQRKHTTKHNLIKIYQNLITKNSHVYFLRYQKGSM